MPPQIDQNNACDDNSVPSSPDKIDDPKAAVGTENSYWDDPKEDSMLKDKTLSTLDMTALESNHPEEQKKKKDDYWEATPEASLQGKTLSTLDMSLLGNPSSENESNQTPSTAAAVSSTPITAEEPDSAPSYWDDAPIDKSLQGKRLSTLDMTALEHNHPDQSKAQTDDYWGGTPKEESLQGKTISTLDMTALVSNHPDERQQKKEKDDYWEAAPIDKSLQGKRLSTLDMTALESNHPDEKKEQADSYWDAPEEEKLKGKRISKLDMKTLEHSTSGAAIVAEEEESPASYWDEAPIDKSLQGKRLSSIELSALEKQHVDEEKPKQTSPYWDWHGVKAIKKTLSKLSLSNLRKGSSHDVVLDDECVHGGSNNSDAKNNSNNQGTEPTVRPITKKTHKLRDSWKASFQRLSSTTLDMLDESGKSTGSGPRFLGRRMFSRDKSGLDASSGSRSSQMSIGEDAIMF